MPEGFATSFADPKDVARFKRCKEQGGSDDDCFKVGDNAIGLWGDDTSEGTGPSCAVPPDDMIDQWGSIDAARNKAVSVTANGLTCICQVKDRMKWKRHITNGAVIDLNPDACAALDLQPPVRVRASWEWV